MIKPDVRGFFDPITATWTYVVWNGAAGDKKCAVIDSVLDYDASSGRTSTASADKVIYFIRSKGLELEWILETHIHADHLTAAHYIKGKLGGKTGISSHILEVLKTWRQVFHNTDDTPQDGSQFDHLFADDEGFSIGGMTARIIHVPGHTPADTAYIIGDAVFVGDAMFLPDVGTGRCDFPGGSAADSYDSTRKLLALPENVRMYVGHDYPPEGSRGPLCMATIAEQKTANALAAENVGRDAFIKTRMEADKDKNVPSLLLPSLQVNLRAGDFGKKTDGVQYIKIPLNTV